MIKIHEVKIHPLSKKNSKKKDYKNIMWKMPILDQKFKKLNASLK